MRFPLILRDEATISVIMELGTKMQQSSKNDGFSDFESELEESDSDLD